MFLPGLVAATGRHRSREKRHFTTWIDVDRWTKVLFSQKAGMVYMYVLCMYAGGPAVLRTVRVLGGGACGAFLAVAET